MSKKRITSVKATSKILKILGNLTDGTAKIKVLSAVGALDGGFWIEEMA